MKREKRLALILAGVMTLASCSGPGGEETPAPEASASSVPVQEAEWVEFALPCYPGAGFHPIDGTNRVNLILVPLLYQGLFSVDPEFQAQTELCESYTVSEDGLTWTLELGHALFSDGSPLTAAEVVSSLNRARQSRQYSGRLTGISRVTAEGDRQVVITLSRPNGGLTALLDVPVVKETEDPLRPLGTGPYELEEGQEGLLLRARAGADVPVETIPLRTMGGSNDLIYAFDAGEISLVDTDLTGASALGYSGRFEVADYSTTDLLYLGCNTRSGACQDRLVRQAVARAADREGIVKDLLAGHGVASALVIHPASKEYDGAVAAQWTADREAALALLRDAGWSLEEDGRLRKKGKELEIKLVVNQDNTYKVSVADEMGRALEELGCAVTVEKLPWDEFVTALERREFDLYLGETMMTADFDPEALVSAGGSLNYGGFGNDQVQGALESWREARGETRDQAGSQLWAAIAQEAPVIPLCFKNGSLLIRWGQVSGASPTQRNVFAGLEGWTILHS